MTTREYDVANYLDSEEMIAAYLTAALEENDIALFNEALGDVARERGITQLSSETGLSRMGLYKSLSENGNPTIYTLQKVLASLNLQLIVSPAGQS